MSVKHYDWSAYHAYVRPTKIAIRDLSAKQSLTYKELDDRACLLANWLQSVGVKKGDRIAMMMPNLLQYPVAIFGALRAGLIVVNVNPLYTPRELEHQLRDSGSKAILIFENSALVLSAVFVNTEIEHVIITKIGDFLGPIKGTL